MLKFNLKSPDGEIIKSFELPSTPDELTWELYAKSLMCDNLENYMICVQIPIKGLTDAEIMTYSANIRYVVQTFTGLTDEEYLSADTSDMLTLSAFCIELLAMMPEVTKADLPPFASFSVFESQSMAMFDHGLKQKYGENYLHWRLPNAAEVYALFMCDIENGAKAMEFKKDAEAWNEYLAKINAMPYGQVHYVVSFFLHQWNDFTFLSMTKSLKRNMTAMK